MGVAAGAPDEGLGHQVDEAARIGLERGVIGGRINVQELNAAWPAFEEGGFVSRSILQTITREQADLDPDGAGVCQSISVALVFEGIRAVRGETR